MVVYFFEVNEVRIGTKNLENIIIEGSNMSDKICRSAKCVAKLDLQN